MTYRRAERTTMRVEWNPPECEAEESARRICAFLQTRQRHRQHRRHHAAE